MKPKVIITKPVPKEVEEYIAAHCDIKEWDRETKPNMEKLFRLMEDVEGLYVTTLKINEELLQHAPKLKVVSTASVGYNHFDIEAMKKKKVIGTHTPYVLDDTVADLAFALLLSSARRIAELDQYVKEGNWKREDNENLFGIDVHHKNLGIIGMGRIGEAIAKRAKFGFNMNVRYYNRRRKEEAEKRLGVVYSLMEELLEESDFIIVVTPLTPETYHMIGEKEFSAMKESAIFINISRGQTVDEAALIRALEQKKIRGAGLDVYTKEPVEAENALLKLKNVVTVPHIGSATHKTRFDMAMTAAKDLVKAVYGERPANVVEELKEIK